MEPKKIYSFKENTIKFNVNPQDAGEEIEKIIKKYGSCKPEDVVEVARDENNPLHNVFDWDDTSAANKYRLHIARILIGSITVTYKYHESVRANYSVKFIDSTDKENRAYVSIEEAVKPDYELQFRKEACNYLKVFCKRYESFDYLQTEVQNVRLIIDKMEAYNKSLEEEKELVAAK
jgi:hypothetical protein